MEIAYLLVTLLCPVSMVAMMGWWVWSMRGPKMRGPKKSSATGPARSAADDVEITRLRAHVDQLEAQSRDQDASARR